MISKSLMDRCSSSSAPLALRGSSRGEIPMRELARQQAPEHPLVVLVDKPHVWRPLLVVLGLEVLVPIRIVSLTLTSLTNCTSW